TPDELPTIIEALADTLTDRCLRLLRVLRVPASLHTERYGGRTPLAGAEPPGPDAPARRAQPPNPWLLPPQPHPPPPPPRGLRLPLGGPALGRCAATSPMGSTRCRASSSRSGSGSDSHGRTPGAPWPNSSISGPPSTSTRRRWVTSGSASTRLVTSSSCCGRTSSPSTGSTRRCCWAGTSTRT